ncbi:hypothetical protein [Paenibacillus nanensis]|nr:hypothetical protein [Paenibacillus nanensis]
MKKIHPPQSAGGKISYGLLAGRIRLIAEPRFPGNEGGVKEWNG